MRKTGRKGWFVRLPWLAAALLVVALPAQAQELKIASLAPEGSSWMQVMRQAADVVKQRTEGRVVLKFYGGGVMGNDKKVLRKIRVGQLDGSTFTPSGLAEVYPNVNVYGLPLLFQSLDEVDRVRAAEDANMRAGLEAAGFVSFGFAEGG